MQKSGKFCLENAIHGTIDEGISVAKGIVFTKIGLANGAILKLWAAHPYPKFSQWFEPVIWTKSYLIWCYMLDWCHKDLRKNGAKIFDGLFPRLQELQQPNINQALGPVHTNPFWHATDMFSSVFGFAFTLIHPRNGAKATFTLLHFHFYPFLLMKTLPVHIAPFSNRYAMKTIGVHIAPAKRCC